MKIFHIADLHLGKKVHEFSMFDEQKHILEQILDHIYERNADALLISGDIYDKAVPSTEAVHLLDQFLTALSEREIATYMISGNHDSAQRLDFASRLLAENKIHIAGIFQKDVLHVSQKDDYGEVTFTLMPFLKPVQVASAFGLDKTFSYEEAMAFVLDSVSINKNNRNVLLAHQFVTWRKEIVRSDSETYSVGGIDEMDASIFEAFDYVALGHLHAPQRVGYDHIRYAGSPLKYSFSEIRQKKGITVIDIREKGNITYNFIPLSPIRQMREIKGPLQGLLELGRMDEERYDYIRAILTDNEALLDPIGQLRSVYPNLMTLEMEREGELKNEILSLETKVFHPDELFFDFFEKQNKKELSHEQRTIVDKIWSGLAGDGE